MTLFGLALLALGGAATFRLATLGGPVRAGPWPGLTPRGAGVLLGCAALLAGGQLVFESVAASSALLMRPIPDLPILAVLACAPLALATRLTKMPGAAAAVCGAYLLPRSLLSLVDPAFEPPPLLLVPAVVFDLSLWLRPSDLASVTSLWPGRRTAWRTRGKRGNRGNRGPRRPGPFRALIGGGLFGLTLALIEPAFLILLGANRATWSGPELTIAAGLCAAACALLGLSGRDREW